MEPLESRVFQVAREEMKRGHNCCQSILLAASRVWNIPVGADIMAAASLFGEGMGSGCTCGALAGMVMASGIMEQYYTHPLGRKLSQKLHDEFKREFGATCCRAIKRKRGPLENIGNRACMELTGKAAQILLQEWEMILDEAAARNSGDYTHPQRG